MRHPKFRVTFAVAVLGLLVAGAGCNAYDAATRASNVVAAIINVADAETPSVPAADQATYAGFVTLAKTLEAQLQTCLAAADSGMSKSSKMLSCFNSFAVGLNSPTELAALRVMNPGTQSTVQKYVTAITVGLNAAVGYFGGTASKPPVITQAPTAEELRGVYQTPQVQAALWQPIR